MRRKWLKTNEDLPSIFRAMEPRPDDYILAVGGAGCQAFMLLEYAGRVLAVDEEPTQVKYIIKRAGSIREGDYDAFRKSGNKDYFNNERLDRIRAKILTPGSFDVMEGDIVDACRSMTGFNKVYLSNALSGHPDELGPRICAVSENLPKGGLVYASNGETIIRALDGSGLAFDELLAAITQDERWHPIVLIKQ